MYATYRNFKEMLIWIQPSMRSTQFYDLDVSVRIWNGLTQHSYHWHSGQKERKDPIIQPADGIGRLNGVRIGELLSIQNFGRKSIQELLDVLQAVPMDKDQFEAAEIGFKLNSSVSHPANIYIG